VVRLWREDGRPAQLEARHQQRQHLVLRAPPRLRLPVDDEEHPLQPRGHL